MSRKTPSRHWRDRAMDAIEASEETRGFVQGMNFATFQADARTMKAALANFAIIGEATAHIPQERLASHPEIPWVKVRATRNYIAHVYFGLDLKIIWDSIHDDLVPLEYALREMLQQKDEERREPRSMWRALSIHRTSDSPKLPARPLELPPNLLRRSSSPLQCTRGSLGWSEQPLERSPGSLPTNCGIGPRRVFGGRREGSAG